MSEVAHRDLSTTVPARMPARSVWLAVVALLIVIVGFALYSGQVWEDFLITFRQSKHLANGNGLVFQPGERVHGFTSPLNVLIPAIAFWLYPKLDYVWPLWAFRGFGLIVLALGLVRFLRTHEINSNVRWLFVALLALQNKTIAFAMNGQEAALVVGFLAPALACAVVGHGRHWVATGLCWSGLMWSRPDCPIYIAALVAGGFFFGEEPRQIQWRGILKATAVTIAIYGPWFAWAWIYYGTPIPHTITAKMGATGAAGGWTETIGWAAHSWTVAIGSAFEPIYAEAGGWPDWLTLLSRGLGLWCAIRWVLGGSVLRRAASWVFFCGSLYLMWVGTVGMMYPWYFPPLGLCAAVVLALDAAALWRATAERRLGRSVLLAAIASILAAFTWVWVFTAEQQRARQHFVEDGVREQVGRWLKTAVAPGERVFLEPIGYIGYFSEARLLDYPGLVSPSVVQARRKRGSNFAAMIDELHPEWLALRESEYRRLREVSPVLNPYEVKQAFGVAREALRYRQFPGAQYIFADSSFLVLRRNRP